MTADPKPPIVTDAGAQAPLADVAAAIKEADDLIEARVRAIVHEEVLQGRLSTVGVVTLREMVRAVVRQELTEQRAGGQTENVVSAGERLLTAEDFARERARRGEHDPLRADHDDEDAARCRCNLQPMPSISGTA